MSFKEKVISIFFLLIIGLPFGVWKYRQLNRPAPTLLPPREEITITIIPGWNLQDVARYLVAQQVASNTDQVFTLTGVPASKNASPFSFPETILASKPAKISIEGYLAPETYRVYKDAKLPDILGKLLDQRTKQIETVSTTLSNSGESLHTILTMASIVEEEARIPEDRKMVADILWRRYKNGWALQVDSSVHYAINKTGDVFTNKNEREVDSPWNTYKYAGLPPGPICNPGMNSIEAALVPTKNEYWYFLSGKDGVMHYAKTLEEHNWNKNKYL